MRMRSAPLASGLLASFIVALVVGQGGHAFSLAERRIEPPPTNVSARRPGKAPAPRRPELTVAACQWTRTAGSGRFTTPIQATVACGRIRLPDRLAGAIVHDARRRIHNPVLPANHGPRSPPLS